MHTTLRLLAASVLVTMVAACGDDTGVTATPTPTGVSEVSATPSPEATPTSTWVPPPPVTNRLDIPRVSPGTDYPSVGLRADGVPLAAEGTLVVYARDVRGEARVEVVVFDLAKGERLSSFPLEANQRFSVQLAGNRVVASFGSKLWSYALDGSDGLLLDDKLTTSYMLASPDGRHVAVTGSEEGFLASVAIIDVQTGLRRTRVDLTETVDGWFGEPHPVRWLSDEEVLIGGLCNCDAVLEENFVASVDLDGLVGRLSDDSPPAKSRTVRIVDAFDTSCVLGGFAGGRSVQIVNTTSSVVLAEATEDAPIFLGASLSPDGSEALVTSLVADEELRPRLNTALVDGRCIDNSELPDRIPALSVLSVDTGLLEPVQSLLDVLDRWYDPLPVFVCDGEERAGTDTREWLDPVPWRSPVGFGAPWGFTSQACQSSRTAHVEMRVGTTVVDTDAQGYRVLGFLDSTRVSED